MFCGFYLSISAFNNSNECKKFENEGKCDEDPSFMFSKCFNTCPLENKYDDAKILPAYQKYLGNFYKIFTNIIFRNNFSH